MNYINSFQGEYRFLSNFWPCAVFYEGESYPTLEHAYVSAQVSDPAVRAAIRNCETPGEAKTYLQAHSIERDIAWTIDKKLQVMEALLLAKFGGQEPLLTKALLQTGDAMLVEGNDWNDRFWGVCEGTGENHLGKLLMKTRTKLLKEKQFITDLLQVTNTYEALASAAGIPASLLYKKMLALGISQHKYLGYQ